MPAADPLEDALLRLDDAFAGLPDHYDVEGCGYCYSAADLASLTGPSRYIRDQMVSHVVSENIFHWTDFGGLMHRLAPRILRLLVRGELAVLEDRVGRRFVQAGWERWPEQQRAAVSGVLETWWHDTLSRYPANLEIGSVLEVLGVISGQVRTWLRTWTRTRTWTAARHVADLCSNLRYGALWVGSHDESDLSTEVADWLLTDGLDLLTELPEGPALDRALDGLEILEFAREYQ